MFVALLKNEFFKDRVLPRYQSGFLPQYRSYETNSYPEYRDLEDSNIKVKIIDFMVKKRETNEPGYNCLPHWTYIRDVAMLLVKDCSTCSNPYYLPIINYPFFQLFTVRILLYSGQGIWLLIWALISVCLPKLLFG